ncbi:hypothetical protein HYC85_011827 [Camellia sinensis]|uniref:Uncharacterized protein n=1 Tax=Camellia sinensis TaxID=4442 RepID=A0A7J7HD45_CAMSI|nr:hypothetical protein HYC85_011827 [Camellia sinensis]
MVDQSRPVTGYLVAGYPHPLPQSSNNTNGYPAADTSYPYAAPPPQAAYYYVQPYPDLPATFLRRLFGILIASFIIVATIAFIVWLILRPRLPEFQVDSLSLSPISVFLLPRSSPIGTSASPPGTLTTRSLSTTTTSPPPSSTESSLSSIPPSRRSSRGRGMRPRLGLLSHHQLGSSGKEFGIWVVERLGDLQNKVNMGKNVNFIYNISKIYIISKIKRTKWFKKKHFGLTRVAFTKMGFMNILYTLFNIKQYIEILIHLTCEQVTLNFFYFLKMYLKNKKNDRLIYNKILTKTKLPNHPNYVIKSLCFLHTDTHTELSIS